ncbi:hypothetical protein PAXRUDRAFT_172887 [Paxillus rubicundulus Ve08.2h10]|uniref:Uncharacterized protein n=1 Tax=Paxillus rubicundulus Ve08.2h10 TaxID=930991 RepID=A0A0D0CJS8_9AGAM|nr:hypothetical protein PAXRUDRAFT_172887 [Paxillus rubicundulus Ve08.2h10]
MDPAPQNGPNASNWIPVASNINPPSQKQTRCVENRSTASKTDPPTSTHAFHPTRSFSIPPTHLWPHPYAFSPTCSLMAPPAHFRPHPLAYGITRPSLVPPAHFVSSRLVRYVSFLLYLHT